MPDTGDPLVFKTTGGDSVRSQIASFIDTGSVRASGFGSAKVILYGLHIASFIDTDSARHTRWLAYLCKSESGRSPLPLSVILIPYGIWIG